MSMCLVLLNIGSHLKMLVGDWFSRVCCQPSEIKIIQWWAQYMQFFLGFTPPWHVVAGREWVFAACLLVCLLCLPSLPGLLLASLLGYLPSLKKFHLISHNSVEYGYTRAVQFFKAPLASKATMKRRVRVIWRQCNTRDTVEESMSKPSDNPPVYKNKYNQETDPMDPF